MTGAGASGGSVGAAGSSATTGMGGAPTGAAGSSATTGAGGGPVGAGSSGGGSGTCGNGTVEAGESCDGSAMQSATCSALGFTGGTLACSSSCQFAVAGCTGGTLTPSVSASRTSCTAPCGVFFDATATAGLSGSDYVGANWNWDFGDPSSPHRGAIGFVVAHVFDSPGTYQVTTRVHDLAGAAGLATTTITVSPMSGTTYYVSASGSDSNAGTSTTTAFSTLGHALTLAGTNKSILLRRGDSFGMNSVFTVSGVSGPFLIGAYSDPADPSSAAPIVSSSASQIANVLSPDIRLTDLHLVETAGGSGIGFANAPNALVERVEIEGVGSASVSGLLSFGIDGSDTPIFFFDDHAHDFIGYGLYGSKTNDFAMVGTTIDSFTGGEHGVRLQGGNTADPGFSTNAFVSESTFAPKVVSGAFQTQDSITFRGDNTKIVFVGNHTTDGAHFQPQNTGVVEHISQVLDEGNTFIDPLATDPSYVAENIAAQHVYIRNNLYVNCGLPLAIQGYAALPANWTDQIFVYNNTAYTYVTAPAANTNQFFMVRHFSTTGALTVRDNIFSEGAANSNSAVVSMDGAGTDTFDHNLIYAPNATLSSPNTGTGGLTADPQFVSSVVTSAAAFTLASVSPARNAGMNTHVYEDYDAVPRTTATTDMGYLQ